MTRMTRAEWRTKKQQQVMQQANEVASLLESMELDIDAMAGDGPMTAEERDAKQELQRAQDAVQRAWYALHVAGTDQ